jgi:hypothetical protein
MQFQRDATEKEINHKETENAGKKMSSRGRIQVSSKITDSL